MRVALQRIAEGAKEKIQMSSQQHLDKFALPGGYVFFQQYRKCGKPSCATCRTGPGHGPYWFARSPAGRVRYLGRDLPSDIAQRRLDYIESLSYASSEYTRLLRAVSALSSYLSASYLSPPDLLALDSFFLPDVVVDDDTFDHLLVG